MANALPLFHLYGDPPDDQAFDFIHVETIASRSSIHDWTIRAHRHRNLFQILLLERGGGEMTFDVARLTFAAPAAILVPAAVAHGFRFERERHRRLGGELHRGRRRRADGSVRRSAGAAAPACGAACHSHRRRNRAGAALGAVCGALRRAQPGARRLSPGDARAARADRGRRGASCRQPRPHRQRHLASRRCHSDAIARAGRRVLPQGAAARLLCGKARHDGRPAQRPCQALDRRHRRPS